MPEAHGFRLARKDPVAGRSIQRVERMTVIPLVIALSVAVSLAARPTAARARGLNATSTASPIPNGPSSVDCGPAWREVASPNTPDEKISLLYGVAAVSADDVWSVGITYISGLQTIRPLIEHWDGTAWSIVPSPAPAESRNSSLWGVSAASANDVWAVGSYYTAGYASGKTLIEHWDGTAWSIIPSPNATGPNVLPNQALQGITAVSANDAWAVGYYAVLETDAMGITRSTAKTMVQHWDGTTWSIVPSPNPARPGTQGSYLLAITAASANDVWAVGRYDAAVGVDYATPVFQTLIEHWDGTAWSVVSSPTPPGQIAYNHLLGVSAAAADDVWAVGISGIYTAGFGSIAQTLIEHWDGSAWSIVPSPDPGIPGLGQGNWLYGVSAASADDAWAVGFTATATTPGQQALIEHWDGSAWSVVPSPGSGREALIGVAAVSADDVWTTGARTAPDGSSTTTLTERYSDTCAPTPSATSVDGLQAEPTGATLGVSGRASFGGEVPRVLASDPAGDAPIAAPASSAAGLDLLEGRIHRPDPSKQEIIFEWRVAALPASGSLPEAVRYVWAVQVGTARYWIQAKLSNVVATTTQSDAAGHVSHAGGAFQLLINCPNPSTVFGCSHVAWLEGEFDPADSTVRVRVPLSTAAAPALKPGAVLAPQPPATGGSAIYAGYQATISTPEMRDDAAWPAAATYRIPAPEVLLGIAPVGTDPSLVAFDTPATLAPDGAFSGSLDLTGLTAGTYEMWARACFGDNCGLRAVTIERS